MNRSKPTPPPAARQSMSDRLRELRERGATDAGIVDIVRTVKASGGRVTAPETSDACRKQSADRACPACKRKGATSRANPKCRYCGFAKPGPK